MKYIQPKPYEMGMQVSRSVDTEVSEEDIICGIAEVFGFNVQGTRNAEGVCSLPMNVEITDEEVDYVIFAVRSFYRK